MIYHELTDSRPGLSQEEKNRIEMRRRDARIVAAQIMRTLEGKPYNPWAGIDETLERLTDMLNNQQT